MGSIMLFKTVSGMIAIASLAACTANTNVEPVKPQAKAPQVKVVEKIETVKVNDKIVMTEKDVDCLAKNIYHEAGVESTSGKIAVAQVTVNRLKSGNWGNSVCKVVYAKSQFSWTLSKKLKNEKPKGELWKASLEIAKSFARGIRAKGMANVDHYHTDYIKKPFWATKKTAQIKVGQHIFYS